MNENKKQGWIIPLPLICAALLAAFDQLIKYLAVTNLKGHEPIVLIQGVLELQYLENHGAAFGMLQNKQYFFWILTIVFILAALWFFSKVPFSKKYLPLIICVTVLLAGAIGNFIDRICYKYVVDFIYFSLINFPVFNVADIYVTLSVIALIALVLFRYKDDNDWDFLKRR